MAVAPTGAIYKALKFDNVSSRTYGVYITGEAVYNAPERDVEMITIPGRNGSFALDNGRFQNIEVSYPAGIFADTEADFRQAISDFRNFLCSRKGYVRLQDEYNPDEYRMAVYKSGLEVTPAQLKAGEFTITFDCKPQRWLTSGESAVAIANSGDTITNPTLFESSPLLEVKGYGNIDFNGYEVKITNETAGTVELLTPTDVWISDFSKAFTFNSNIELLKTGDEISLSLITIAHLWPIVPNDGNTYEYARANNITKVSESLPEANTFLLYSDPTAPELAHWRYVNCQTTFSTLKFTYGTSASYVDDVTFSATITNVGNVTTTTTCSSQISRITVSYDGLATFTVTFFVTASNESVWFEQINNNKSISYMRKIELKSVTGNSTKSYLGNPTYIDCDIGEAYKIENGTYISLNQYIDLGSDLPILIVGNTEFTFDNTITDLQVVPRWWKV